MRRRHPLRTFVISPRGQALVELSLLLPLLLLLGLGTVDVGRAVYISSVTSRMSREGANRITRSSGTTARDAEAMLDVLIDTASPRLDWRRNGCLYVSLLKANAAGVVELEWPEPVSHCEAFRPESRLRGRRQLDTEAQQAVLEGQTLNPGERVALLEAYYQYVPATPVGYLGVRWGSDGTRTLGSAAVFFLVAKPDIR